MMRGWCTAEMCHKNVPLCRTRFGLSHHTFCGLLKQGLVEGPRPPQRIILVTLLLHPEALSDQALGTTVIDGHPTPVGQ